MILFFLLTGETPFDIANDSDELFWRFKERGFEAISADLEAVHANPQAVELLRRREADTHTAGDIQNIISVKIGYSPYCTSKHLYGSSRQWFFSLLVYNGTFYSLCYHRHSRTS